jgi:lipopolysaccharide/colanic/teichoic acid biosynthesis glycosyltransferase
MKRLLDVSAAVIGLLVGSIILVPAMVAVWLQDRHSPFYIAPRAGVGGAPFRMIKLRSMKILADTTGVMSTAGGDPRITAVGRFVRRWKLDELTQLLNVLQGDMSLVGPRPQVMQDVALYTDEERRMLTVRPGITDMASICSPTRGTSCAVRTTLTCGTNNSSGPGSHDWRYCMWTRIRRSLRTFSWSA